MDKLYQNYKKFGMQMNLKMYCFNLFSLNKENDFKLWITLVKISRLNFLKSIHFSLEILIQMQINLGVNHVQIIDTRSSILILLVLIPFLDQD